MERLLNRATEREVRDTLNALHPPLDPARFELALQIWRANRRS